MALTKLNEYLAAAKQIAESVSDPNASMTAFSGITFTSLDYTS
ncbi:hypothetical protein [Nitrosomonas sp.]|nr:hypothetical protein [Nitrosomonas sp.]